MTRKQNETTSQRPSANHDDDNLPICHGREDPLHLLDKKDGESHVDDKTLEKSALYAATVICLKLLERWYELGIRPTATTTPAHVPKGADFSNEDVVGTDTTTHDSLRSVMLRVLRATCAEELEKGENGLSIAETNTKNPSCHGTQSVTICLLLQQLWENPVDDLAALQCVIQYTRQLQWQRALPPVARHEQHLQVRPSRIPAAQLGLYAVQPLPAGTVCCYYSGDIHSVASSQRLEDASYLLRIGTAVARPWWYQALCSSNDESNVDHQLKDDNHEATTLQHDYGLLRQEWDTLNETWSPQEFLVNPTNVHIKARYINDCLHPAHYNVTFVLDPVGERAAVVTLRDIGAGEELYVSYGQAYWDSLEATTGIVPSSLLLE